MNRVRHLPKPEKHIQCLQALWRLDVQNIKSSWWYGTLSPGNKRFLTYRLNLIDFILANSIKPNGRVYKFGEEGLAVTTPYAWGWWLNGVAIRPALLKDVSGQSSGVGSRLIKFIERDAIRNGITLLKLHPGHTNLHHYYDRLGFHYDGILSQVGKVWAKDLGGICKS